LDRFDLRVETIRLTKTELAGPSTGDSTATVRDRVERARFVQTERYGSSLKTNATVVGRELHSKAALSKSGIDTLSEMAETLRFSGRAWTRMVRVARTIADLANDEIVDAEHVGQALAFRFSMTSKEVAA
jgi:magnesium chelatase family protein